MRRASDNFGYVHFFFFHTQLEPNFRKRNKDYQLCAHNNNPNQNSCPQVNLEENFAFRCETMNFLRKWVTRGNTHILRIIKDQVKRRSPSEIGIILPSKIVVNFIFFSQKKKNIYST